MTLLCRLSSFWSLLFFISTPPVTSRKPQDQDLIDNGPGVRLTVSSELISRGYCIHPHPVEFKDRVKLTVGILSFGTCVQNPGTGAAFSRWGWACVNISWLNICVIALSFRHWKKLYPDILSYTTPDSRQSALRCPVRQVSVSFYPALQDQQTGQHARDGRYPYY
jgi:hypothetical protein